MSFLTETQFSNEFLEFPKKNLISQHEKQVNASTMRISEKKNIKNSPLASYRYYEEH